MDHIETGAAGAEQAAPAQPLRELVITLKHPVVVLAKDGKTEIDTITSITMKRPKAKHMRAMDKATGEFGKVLGLVQATTGLPMSVIDEIDGEDVITLATRVADFLGVSLLTGAT
jgi:hypothetical protein